MSEKLTNIVESISNLTVLELAELVKKLEEKFGIQAQAVGFVPQMATAAPSAQAQ
jgi:large subunit ribosomal protein L7/L12